MLATKLMMVTLALTLTSSVVLASSQLSWPMKEWPRQSLKEAGFHEKQFDKFIKYAYSAPGNFKTDSIVVIKDGYLVFEKHANGYKGDQKHALWSMTKTLQNALVGVLEQKGLIKRDSSAQKYFPSISNHNLTIAELLTMSSGIEWVEEHKRDIFKSDTLKYYSISAFKDMAGYAAKRPFKHQPGAHFNYSTVDATLLAATIRGAIGEKDYPEFFWREFFLQIGMQNVAIEADPSGLLGTMGLGYASPYDLAKFGWLYVTGGKVDGKALWPSDWIQFTSQIAPSQKNEPDPDDLNAQNDQAFGAHVWLNKKRPQDKKLPYPDLPEDALLGLGMRGQFVLILPSEKVVLVRTASDTEFFVFARKNFRKELFHKFYASISRGAKP